MDSPGDLLRPRLYTAVTEDLEVMVEGIQDKVDMAPAHKVDMVETEDMDSSKHTPPRRRCINPRSSLRRRFILRNRGWSVGWVVRWDMKSRR